MDYWLTRVNPRPENRLAGEPSGLGRRGPAR